MTVTQLGLLPYVGLVPDIGSGTVGQGEDVEFLWPDRVVAYLEQYAPPDIWTVVGDYPCVLNVMGPDGPGGPSPAGARTFTSPDADEAPWVVVGGVNVISSGYAPEAADLLGIIVTDIVGLNSTVSRNATRKANDLGGATLEKQHAGPREIKVTGVAVATSSMGIEWAERWLTHVLSAPFCDPCEKGAFSFRQCCPAEDLALGYWAVFDAGLISGPMFTPLSSVDAQPGDLTRQSCYLAQVEFTIGCEDPYLYKPWVYVDDFPGSDSCLTVASLGMGIDGAVIDFGDSTAGGLSYKDDSGTSHDVFVFSIAGYSRLVWDGARQRVLIFDTDGNLVYPFFGIDTGGAPLDWPQAGDGCLTAPQFCASFDGSAVHLYRQHKELG